MLTMNPNITFHPEWIASRRQVLRATEIAMKKGRKLSIYSADNRHIWWLFESQRVTLAKDMAEFQQAQFHRELEAT